MKKIIKLSDEELKKGIRFTRPCIVVFGVTGIIFLVLSVIHYLFGFIGLYFLIVAMWLWDDTDYRKIILEIRSNGGKKHGT